MCVSFFLHYVHVNGENYSIWSIFFSRKLNKFCVICFGILAIITFVRCRIQRVLVVSIGWNGPASKCCQIKRIHFQKHLYTFMCWWFTVNDVLGVSSSSHILNVTQMYLARLLLIFRLFLVDVVVVIATTHVLFCFVLFNWCCCYIAAAVVLLESS